MSSHNKRTNKKSQNSTRRKKLSCSLQAPSTKQDVERDVNQGGNLDHGTERFRCAKCGIEPGDGSVEFYILRDGTTMCRPCMLAVAPDDPAIPHCLRSAGSERAWFRSREEAEAFALDPANIHYHGDIAHLCEKCGYWHLSRFEWLYGRLPETPKQPM